MVPEHQNADTATAAGLDPSKFAKLGRFARLWAVGSIHGDVERLQRIHDHIARDFRVGDRIIYLGNMTGRGPHPRETVDELLGFRLNVMSLPSVLASDIAYLRGAQEEMLQKLLQLQFAPDPPSVLSWMLAHGLEPTIRAYGGSVEDGIASARSGPQAITRWTQALRNAIRGARGHNDLFSAVRRAAVGEGLGPHPETGRPINFLFVHANINRAHSLAEQADAFWWGGARFDEQDGPFEGWDLVVRGYSPTGQGPRFGLHVATIDAPGSEIACALLSSEGRLLDQIVA